MYDNTLKIKVFFALTHAEYLRMPKKEYKVTIRGKRTSVSLYEWQWKMSLESAIAHDLEHATWLHRKIEEVVIETSGVNCTQTEVVTYAITRMIAGDE